MDGKVKASVEHKGVAIRSVQLRHRGATYDVPWVAGNRDDIVEDDIVRQEVEEVVSISEPLEAFFNYTKEWIEGTEVFQLERDGLLLPQSTGGITQRTGGGTPRALAARTGSQSQTEHAC